MREAWTHTRRTEPFFACAVHADFQSACQRWRAPEVGAGAAHGDGGRNSKRNTTSFERNTRSINVSLVLYTVASCVARPRADSRHGTRCTRSRKVDNDMDNDYDSDNDRDNDRYTDDRYTD